MASASKNYPLSKVIILLVIVLIFVIYSSIFLNLIFKDDTKAELNNQNELHLHKKNGNSQPKDTATHEKQTTRFKIPEWYKKKFPILPEDERNEIVDVQGRKMSDRFPKRFRKRHDVGKDYPNPFTTKKSKSHIVQKSKVKGKYFYCDINFHFFRIEKFSSSRPNLFFSSSYLCAYESTAKSNPNLKICLHLSGFTDDMMKYMLGYLSKYDNIEVIDFDFFEYIKGTKFADSAYERTKNVKVFQGRRPHNSYAIAIFDTLSWAILEKNGGGLSLCSDYAILKDLSGYLRYDVDMLMYIYNFVFNPILKMAPLEKSTLYEYHLRKRFFKLNPVGWKYLSQMYPALPEREKNKMAFINVMQFFGIEGAVYFAQERAGYKNLTLDDVNELLSDPNIIDYNVEVTKANSFMYHLSNGLDYKNGDYYAYWEPKMKRSPKFLKKLYKAVCPNTHDVFYKTPQFVQQHNKCVLSWNSYIGRRKKPRKIEKCPQIPPEWYE